MSNKFSAYEILDKKRKNLALQEEEIKWFINEFLAEKIPDYQMSALLMAIAINGASTEETAALTDAMLFSGKVFKFEGHNIIDKHSTGGVGDKASFILAPIAAACGVKVPMVAGRALGFTGGTIDKVEAISGFKTTLTNEEFERLLNETDFVLMGQTADIAPADKRIYALRDVTATIESIPLITASIMSKKLAEGANGIVMDIKVGSGAFMKDLDEAKALAESIINTAKRFHKKGTALITNMDQPLGHMVGHSLEIIESIETLKGKGPKDLTELSLNLAAFMILQAGAAKNIAEALKMAENSIESGLALKKFKEMIQNQGGDSNVVENYDLLPLAKNKTLVKAPNAGYIKSFQTAEIGFQLIRLGGGRYTKEDQIDFSVGFEFHKDISDQITEGEVLVTIYHHENQSDLAAKIASELLTEIIGFSKDPVETPKTIHHIMGDFA